MDPVPPYPKTPQVPSNTPPPSMTPPLMKPQAAKKLNLGGLFWIVGIIVFVAASVWAVTWEYSTKYGRRTLPTLSAVQQTVPTPIPDPTSSWKTYTDAANGYIIKYPSEWFLKECPTDPGCAKTDTSVYFKTMNPDNPPPSSSILHYVWISYLPNPSGKEFKDVATQYASADVKANFTYKDETINNQTVYRTTSLPSEFQAEWVFFKKSTGDYIAIAFTPTDLGEKNSLDQSLVQEHMKYYQEFNQMLKTFQFVENITLTPTASVSPAAPTEGVACTQEAKQCADGSYVSRSGPNCEFAACPSQ